MRTTKFCLFTKEYFSIKSHLEPIFALLDFLCRCSCKTLFQTLFGTISSIFQWLISWPKLKLPSMSFGLTFMLEKMIVALFVFVIFDFFFQIDL